MGLLERTATADITRGGQTYLHNLRMGLQVFWTLTILILILGVVSSSVVFFYRTGDYERYVLKEWCFASVYQFVFPHSNELTSFRFPDGHESDVYRDSIINDPYIRDTVKTSFGLVAVSGAIGAGATAFFALAIAGYLRRRGRVQREERFVRGAEIVESDVLVREIKSAGLLGDYTIAAQPIVQNAELQHLLVTGTTGSGKSVAINSLLSQIRSKKQRAIVYDISGDYIKYFYRDGVDVILNPLDARCPIWDVWCEARNVADFDSIAATLIPEALTGSEPFWWQAARTLFSTVASRMTNHPDRSTRKLLNDLLTISLTEASELVRGTEGAALIAEGADKTALSVRATLATNIKSLKFLRMPQEGVRRFSIREWVENDEGDGWVFISTRADQNATLKPLITTWLEIASNALLSMTPSNERRIWFVFDELANLNRLAFLENSLALTRKYGGCYVLGFQSYSQLRKTYTDPGAESIAGACSTWLVGRANDEASASWASESFGSAEVVEPAEAISYGANEGRDGVNLNEQRQTRPVVMPAEFQRLPNLHAYYRPSQGFPIARVTMSWMNYEPIAEPFIPSDLADAAWDLSFPTRDELLLQLADAAAVNVPEQNVEETSVAAAVGDFYQDEISY